MGIKDRLYLNALILVIFAVIFIYLVVAVSSKVSETSEEHGIAQGIETSISELDIVTYEYLLHREKRMEEQWNIKYNSGAVILRRGAEVAGIKSISEDYIDLGRIFLQVTKNYKKTQSLIASEVPQKQIDATILLEERLVGQLLVKSQLIVSAASKLSEKSYNEILEVQGLANAIILILLSIVALSVTTLSFLIARSISKPLDRLQEGVGIIGKGNLTHKIDIKSKDEFGQLAGAFNEMTAKLEESYSGIEAKVREKTKELRKSETRLKKNLDTTERMNKLMVGRELEMVKLKKEIEEFKRKIKN